MILVAPLKEKNSYENICFIDTPGYNSASSEGYTGEDKLIASEFLSRAHAVLWMIGIDATGTIPNNDLKFISNLANEGKKIYLVLTKADLKPPSETGEIMERVREQLEDDDIDFEGISLFSTERNNTEEEIFKHFQLDIWSFLEEQNSSVETKEELHQQLEEVFLMYKDAIENDITEMNNHRSLLKTLELDFMESGEDIEDIAFNSDSKANITLQKLKESFSANKFEADLEKLHSLSAKIFAAFEDCFDE